jgi:Aldehyde dehydrogenase family
MSLGTLSYRFDINGAISAADYIVDSRTVALVAIAIAVGFVSVRWLRQPKIPAIRVPLPAQAQPGWTGQVLSSPSIYTKDRSVIQCYCPATGQLIGTIKAATARDVDVAIENAKAAQVKWRATSFKQRELVLQTLLKFILEHQGILLNAVLTSEDIARVSCRDSGVQVSKVML